MLDNSLTVIRELARQVGKRTKPINLYDRNIRLEGQSADTSSGVFCLQLRYLYKKRIVKIFANVKFIYVSIGGSFNIGDILSINKQNAINLMQSAGGCLVGGRRYPIFTSKGRLAPEHEMLLACPALAALLEGSCLRVGESLHFLDDEITMYLDNPTLLRLRETIDRMADLAVAIQVPEKEMDLALLPLQFHPLIPLIKKWGVADDGERERFLDEQPLAARKRFVEAVAPYLHSIDSYLDSFGEQQPSEEAAALGRLAECAVEAKLLSADK